MHEADDPDAFIYLFYSHVLTREHGAEVDLALVEADSSAFGHRDGTVMKRVFQFLQATILTR